MSVAGPEYSPIFISMTQPRATSFNIQALAAQWRMLVLMLILVGRRVSASNKIGHHDGYRQAEQMELWSRAALACLTQQLTCLQDCPLPDDPKDAHALEHLYLLATCLIGLAMLAAKMKGELKAFAGGEILAANLFAQAALRMAAPRTYSPHYLDSS